MLSLLFVLVVVSDTTSAVYFTEFSYLNLIMSISLFWDTFKCTLVALVFEDSNTEK